MATTLLLVLSACGGRDESRAPDAAASSPAESDATPATSAPPQLKPADMPSSNMPSSSMPAAGAIGFAGFGPAPFGATEEQVRMAWGRELGGMKPDAPGGCYYLMPQPRTAGGYRVAFMFEGDRFVRMDVDVRDIQAPGGGRVGMRAQDIERLYAGHVRTQAHKYVEGGKYLRVPNPDGGSGVVLFETDADGRVVGWRIGEPPQVDYVEGCS